MYEAGSADPGTVQQADAGNWMNATIALSVSVHGWGGSRQAKAVSVQQYSTEIARMVQEQDASVTERLMTCAEYKAIASRDGYAKRWLEARMVPGVPELFRDGVYCVPMCQVSAVSAYMAVYQEERRALVDVLYDCWTTRVREACGKPRIQVSAASYPTADAMRAKYSVVLRWIELGVPGKLALIAPEAFVQAQADLLSTVEAGKAHIESILCTEALELVSNLRGVLQGLDDGTQKKFYDSHIQKIVEWSQLFLEARNVTGFAALADVAERIKAIALGCDKDALKKFSFIRKEIKHDLDGALVALKGLMAAQPTRLIELD